MERNFREKIGWPIRASLRWKSARTRKCGKRWRRLCNEVPEPYRTALILRDLEEMSYEQIAEVLAISLGTVKSRITRGRDALRKKLPGMCGKWVRSWGCWLPPLQVSYRERAAERRKPEFAGRFAWWQRRLR